MLREETTDSECPSSSRCSTTEPTNPVDSNAVAVTLDDGTTILGYLARDMAETFQQRLLRRLPEIVRCPAQLRGGAEGQSIGVVLDFEEVHL
jgi:hypothetical protein